MHDVTAHAAAALSGVLGGLGLSRSKHGVWIALCAVIASTTVAREALGTPFETDAVTVPLLGTVLFLTRRARLGTADSYPFLAVILAYLAANFLAAGLNQPISSSAIRQCLILSVRAGTFWLVVMAMDTAGTARWRLPDLFVGLAVVHAFLSYVAYALVPIVSTAPARIELHGENSVSLSGLFQEPNLLAAFLATVLVIGLPVVAMDASPRSSRLGSVLLGLTTPALVMTYTRAAWLATMAGSLGLLALLFTLDRRQFARGVVLVGFLVACVVASMVLAMSLTQVPPGGLLSSTAWARITDIADPTQSSAAGRLATWSRAINHWSERPLIGHGQLSLHFRGNRGWLYASTVQALHDSGVIGLVAMLLFVGGVAHLTWLGVVAASHREDRTILLGYLFAQGALFFTSQFSSFFWGAYTWVLLGVAVGHARAVIQSDRSSSPNRRGLAIIQNP